jgi:putative redox protein
MATTTIKYLGDLQVECIHEKSGTKIVTDAPVDNNGKGSAFSPTDLCATAYLSCMVTIIGIYCDKNDLTFVHAEGSVNKIMASRPRRIARLEINLDLSGNNWTTDERQAIMKAGEACPVAMSVSEEMEVDIKYQF